MRKCRVVVLVLLVGLTAVAASHAKDKEKETAGRLLTGKVLDRHDNPLTDGLSRQYADPGGEELHRE